MVATFELRSLADARLATRVTALWFDPTPPPLISARPAPTRAAQKTAGRGISPIRVDALFTETPYERTCSQRLASRWSDTGSLVPRS